MNLPANFFSLWFCGLAWVLSFFICLGASFKVSWGQISRQAFNAWLGACVLLMCLWFLRGGFLSGLAYHLLGGVLLSLLSGVHLALIGMAFVLIGLAVAGALDWASLGINYLIMGATPVLIGKTLLHFARYYLPSNYFIYLFFNAFFAGGISLAGSAIFGLMTLFFADAYPADYLFGDALAFYLLLSWSEAFMTGFVMAVLIVYRPHWVLTFEDKYYFKPPRS